MQNATAPDRHVYGLDLLRCVAAFLVAGFHFTRVLGGVEQAFPFGWIGVEIFFVISGYVIAYSAQQGDAWEFLSSRFMRLYPGAWIVAAISFTILAIIPTYYWHTLQIFVFTNPFHLLKSISLTGIGVSASYWTLSVELVFYFCVFTILLAGRLDWLRNLAVVLTCYSAPYLALLALHHLRITNMPFLEFNLTGWNALLLRHGPFFAIGLFLFYAGKSAGRTRWAAGAALLLGFVEIACRATEMSRNHAISDLIPISVVIIEAETVFVLALALAVASLRWNAVFPNRLRPITRALGLATYPFYLLHEILGGLTIYVLLRAGTGPVVAVTCALAAVLALAYIVSSRIEPILRSAIAALLSRKQPASSLGAA